VVGKVLKPRGIKGELKVHILTDFPERFLDRSAYWVGKDENQAKKYGVKSARFHKGAVLIFFDQISSLEEAELLKDQFLYIDESDLTKTDDDFYYDHELVGLNVQSFDGKHSGVLKSVLHYPANDVYELELQGKTICIPATYEFVKLVDLENRLIKVERLDEFL